MKSFSTFDLLPSLQKTLKEKNLRIPTEIQAQVIPLILERKSIVGVSETGSGKTLTYALPLLHILKSLENEGNEVYVEASPRAVVVVPSRDLGEQVAKVFKSFTHETRLRVRTALGGTTMVQSRESTGGVFEILLATPGRLVQLIEKRLIHLGDVRLLVFDEADQMMDQGFLPDSEMIVSTCARGPQLALFSATVSPNVQNLMNMLFQDAEVFRSEGSGKVVATLKTENKTVTDGKRWPVLESILKKPVQGGTLIFTNTREQCDKLAAELNEKGFPCAVYRGEMAQTARRTNLKRFREGQTKILVATDLAARGLDLEGIGRVVNYHLPKQMENYLHRVGRTARAGRTGLVINLVTERDERLIAELTGKKAPPLRDEKAIPKGKVRTLGYKPPRKNPPPAKKSPGRKFSKSPRK